MARKEAESTTAKRVTRRYTLTARQRNFATDQLIPAYMEQLDRNIDAMQQIVDKGGTPELPTVVALSLLAQFANQKQYAQEIADVLTHGRDSDTDDTDEA